MNYSFVFFGSDQFSVIVLEELIQNGFIPTLCITQPDRPKGRNLKKSPTILKEFCIKNKIPFETPEKLKLSSLINSNYDLFIVASYGKIIPQTIIDIPKYGCLNVHPSILPKYRGASPVETAILEDTKETGVTIMLMDAQMDHGPIVKQKKYTFDKWPAHRDDVRNILAHIGGKLLSETIEPFIKGDIDYTEQNHTEATFTKIIQKEDGKIELTDTDYKTYLKYLALTPWPGLFFFIEKNNSLIRIKVDSAHYDEEKGFVIDTVIPEGKKVMNWESFKNGYLK